MGSGGSERTKEVPDNFERINKDSATLKRKIVALERDREKGLLLFITLFLLVLLGCGTPCLLILFSVTTVEYMSLVRLHPRKVYSSAQLFSERLGTRLVWIAR